MCTTLFTKKFEKIETVRQFLNEFHMLIKYDDKNIESLDECLCSVDIAKSLKTIGLAIEGDIGGFCEIVDLPKFKKKA
jgi:hypothetical protein